MVLRGPLVARVGLSVPRLWGTNTTRAGCTGRRLLMLCRVSVAVAAVDSGLRQSCNGLFFSYFSFPFNISSVGDSTWPFQFFPFNNTSFSKYPETVSGLI